MISFKFSKFNCYARCKLVTVKSNDDHIQTSGKSGSVSIQGESMVSVHGLD